MFFANRKSRREKMLDKCPKMRDAKERKRFALAVSAVPCVVGAVAEWAVARCQGMGIERM